MDWQDSGTILSTRLHGESSAIVEVFTATHGRHLGVVRGGASRKMAATLMPGSHVALTWRARLVWMAVCSSVGAMPTALNRGAEEAPWAVGFFAMLEPDGPGRRKSLPS